MKFSVVDNWYLMYILVFSVFQSIRPLTSKLAVLEIQFLLESRDFWRRHDRDCHRQNLLLSSKNWLFKVSSFEVKGHTN